jgi:hypothetical protein
MSLDGAMPIQRMRTARDGIVGHGALTLDALLRLVARLLVFSPPDP